MTHTRAKLSQLVAVPILPLPAGTGYYLSPRHETFIFRPFTGETRRKPRAFATFRLALFTTFFTAQMGRGKIQRCFTSIFSNPGTVGVGVHTTNGFHWSQQDGRAVNVSRQLPLCLQKVVPQHSGLGWRSLRPISNYRWQPQRTTLCEKAAVPVCITSMAS
jgi:hypothetical protein